MTRTPPSPVSGAFASYIGAANGDLNSPIGPITSDRVFFSRWLRIAGVVVLALAR